MAEKILTRGTITAIQHDIEDRLRSTLSSEAHVSLRDPLLCPIAENRSCPQLDSDQEREFFSKLLIVLLGKDYPRWVIPQVELASLIPSPASSFVNQAVDFLICKPPSLKIVVEIDGGQHENQTGLDEERDAALVKHGYTVFRIPAAEVTRGRGPRLDELRSFLSKHASEDIRTDDTSSAEKFVLASRYVHTIQIALLQAMQLGLLRVSPPYQISTDLSRLELFTPEESQTILNCASDGLADVLLRLASIYGAELPASAPDILSLSFGGGHRDLSPDLTVSSIYVPFDIAAESVPTNSGKVAPPKHEDLLYFLQYLFRKETFWEGQEEAIGRVLAGNDTLVLLPTGAGKSIAFQLASMLLPGVTIVVAPILSLIADQIENLAWSGISRVGKITSQLHAMDRKTVSDLLGQGHYLLCYVAPERFQTELFRESLRGLTVHTPVAMVAVDEAHCVSEWGHDFRPAYLNIGHSSRDYCSQHGNPPPIIGLTGTASRAVLRDVQRELQIPDFDALITPHTFDREELQFKIIRCSSSEKQARMKGLLGQLLPREFGETAAAFFQLRGDYTRCGLVFCPHVNGNFGVSQVAHELSASLGIAASFYSGSAPKGMHRHGYDDHKAQVARDFKRNRLALLVATKAFGMGIDKPNVRYSVHFGLPSSIESFYQEAGRAGRDRKKAICTILVSDDDPHRTGRLLSPRTSIEKLARKIEALHREEADDITRALWFHVNAFRGVEQELRDVERVLDAIGNLTKRRRTSIRVKNDELKETEKALHRLLVLGIVDDYTLDYSDREFKILISAKPQQAIVNAYTKYLSGYLRAKMQPEERKANGLLGSDARSFVLGMSELLLKFVYEVIEKGRRAALREMLAACKKGVTAHGFRARILRYLEATAYSEDIDKILAQDDAGLDLVVVLFEEVASPKQAAEVRGQVARYLESYPDHPALLMLRALSELYSRNADEAVAREHLIASIDSMTTNYEVPEANRVQFIVWGLSRVADRNAALCEALVGIVLDRWGTREIGRRLVENIRDDCVSNAKRYLLMRLVDRIAGLDGGTNG